MYSLFSNIINSQSTEDNREHIKKWNRFELIDYIKMKADEILKTCCEDVYNEAKVNIYHACDCVRGGNISLAHEIYLGFYYELTTPIYTNGEERKKVYGFVNSLDYTDIFYNIAKLKWDCGDYDNSLYYILQADSENMKHNGGVAGEFVQSLLNSDGLVLWNFVPFIVGDFGNYRNQFNIYRMESFFGRNIDSAFIKEILNDFELLVLLQFINSINRYHNFQFMSASIYKSLRQYRVLGELSWLFECYLKNKFNISDAALDSLIKTKLLSRSKKLKEIYSEFDIINELSTGNTRSNKYKEEGIEFLVCKLRTETDSDRIAAMSLKILYFVRNYTSHSMDSNFFVFKDSKYAVELYLIILNCYLIAYKLI